MMKCVGFLNVVLVTMISFSNYWRVLAVLLDKPKNQKKKAHFNLTLHVGVIFKCVGCSVEMMQLALCLLLLLFASFGGSSTCCKAFTLRRQHIHVANGNYSNTNGKHLSIRL